MLREFAPKGHDTISNQLRVTKDTAVQVIGRHTHRARTTVARTAWSREESGVTVTLLSLSAVKQQLWKQSTAVSQSPPELSS